MSDFDTLYEEVSDMVPKKFYRHFFNEMEYHEFKFKRQRVDDFIILDFVDKNKNKLIVFILYNKERSNLQLYNKRQDYKTNIDKYINESADHLFIYDTPEDKAALMKHLRKEEFSKVLRCKSSYSRDIYNVLKDNEYEIMDKDMIKHIESMRMLDDLRKYIPKIALDDPICHILRAKPNQIIKRSFIDPATKNFVFKYFLVQ